MANVIRVRNVRRILLVAGVLAALLGLIWIGQGTGIFPYPASSFMIDQSRWAWRGLAVMAAGLAAVALSRRL